jgi:hypothetical protein
VAIRGTLIPRFYYTPEQGKVALNCGRNRRRKMVLPYVDKTDLIGARTKALKQTYGLYVVGIEIHSVVAMSLCPKKKS